MEGSGEGGGYAPSDLRSAYNLPNSGGAGLTIAITIAYNYPTAESDLAAYRERYELPPCTTANGCFKKVNQIGEAGNYPEANSEWASEAALDLDMTSAICPECKLTLVEAKSSNSEDLVAAVNEAAALGAGVISDSWGSASEYPEETAFDASFEHPGTPVLFASGDSGYGTSYPAASPDVIAVGGTSLHKSASARGWQETAWSGAGSGCSEYEAKPAWQSDLGCGRRSVADVAAVADPYTPVSIYDSFGHETHWLLYGGTSVATPLMAGVEALSGASERAQGARLFWEEGPAGKLFDVGEGRNGLCEPEIEYLCRAQLGYDGPTGWGTPGGSRPGPPDAATYEPSSVKATEAVLTGAVNPNGEETSYRFEYGTGSSYGTSVPMPGGKISAGTNPVTVTERITGLQLEANYHYRLLATNKSGTTYGKDESFETSMWSAQYMPFAKTRDEMFGVSCVTTSFCVAVGSQLVVFEPIREFTNNEPLAERWNGSQWSREAVPVPHPAGEGYYNLLSSVSCTSSEFCMAVGENYELPRGYQPLAERWNGSAWSIVSMPMPMPSEAQTSPNGQRELRLHGISCVSPTFCVAVGSLTKTWNTATPEDVDTVVYTWDGSSWTVEPSPNPSTSPWHVLWGVSCVSIGSCVAVGENRSAFNSAESTLIESWDGTQWAIDSAPTGTGSLMGVSCSAQTACMAVGGTEEQGGNGLAERWNGATWSSVSLGQPMRGVSCLAGDWCVAAGGQHGTDLAFSELWNGARWIVEPYATPTGVASGRKETNDVSCDSSDCTAVGWFDSGTYSPLAERFDRSALPPPPGVEDNPVGQISQTSAVLEGHVDNNNAARGTDCYFVVALKSAPGQTIDEVPCKPSYVTGASNTAVEAVATSLTANTEYVYRAVAANEGGSYPASPDESFTTLPNVPVVGNDPVGALGQTTAVLRAHVDNEGAASGSSCRFVVALASSPGNPVAEPACNISMVTGAVSTPVEGSVGGLTPNTAYVYRVVATNSSGTSTGAPDESFATLPNGPAVGNDPADSLTQTTAVLHGRVDNEGAAGGSLCRFVVALASSPETPIAEPDCSLSLVTGAGGTAIEAAVTGLAPNTAYVYRVVATNNGGTSIGAPDESFATLPNVPVVGNDPVGALGQTTAVLRAHVDNEGAASGSSCRFVVALASSPGTPVAEPSCAPDPVTGAGSIPVEGSVGGLVPNTAYVYRVVATNSSGISVATPDQKFATQPSPPTAVFSTTPADPVALSPIAFDASPSVDTDGTILIYVWNFGDGAYGIGASASHAYGKAGEYTVTLEVLDSKGLIDSTHRVIHVNPTPNAFSIVRIKPVHDGIVLTLRAPGAGRFRATATVISRAHARRGRIRRQGNHVPYGSGSVAAHAPGLVQLLVRPRRAIRASPPRRGAHQHIEVAITFSPNGGQALTRHIRVLGP